MFFFILILTTMYSLFSLFFCPVEKDEGPELEQKEQHSSPVPCTLVYCAQLSLCVTVCRKHHYFKCLGFDAHLADNR